MDTIDVRSPQGHAAFSMQGIDDRWIMIQQNTFKNWANDQLQQVDESVENLQTDFCDGIKLCSLMEILQGRRVGRVVKKPNNQHQYLENINLALRAMSRDGIKLVNIGAEDIINGNLRLIMGLIWRLILKYQISQSKVPPKKLMLSWINAIMPDMDIGNFSHHWNDGIALHGLIEYCRPGTCPNWRQLSRREGLNNCQHGMELAKDLFDIPMVVSPENLASPDLDELSGMTYLSYFMKMDSPGYHATLGFVNRQIPDCNIKNFQTDWNDGSALAHMVLSFNGVVEGWPTVNRNDCTGLTQLGIKGGKELGVEPVISAKEMADAEVDHLGIMAYAAWFEHLHGKKPIRTLPPPPVVVAARPVTPPPPIITKNPAEQLALNAPDRDTTMGNSVQFTLECLDGDVDHGKVRIEVQGPSSTPPVRINWDGRQGFGEFVPMEPGPHRIVVYNAGEVVQGAPCDLEVGIDAQSITLAGQVTEAPVGVVLPLRLNAADVRRGAVKVEARSPSGRIQDMSVIETNGVYTANFTPTEVGDWNISIMYDGQHIQGSPFSVRVYDAAQVKVFGLEGGSVGRMFSFSVDTSGAGEGELTVNIMHEGRTVPVQVYPEGRGMYRVTFTPDGAGIYSIKVYFAGMEVAGSPYTLEIVDSSMVTANGEGLSSIEVNRRSTFVVNTGQKGSTGDIRVNITSPRDMQVPCDILNNGDGTYTIQYTANDVGEYTIDVFYYGKPIQGSPFRVQAFDWNRISIRNLPQTCMVGKLCEFDIDAQNAGSGNLEIMINEGLIPCSVHNMGNRQFHASFMPREAMSHFVDIRFNGKSVNGSPWTVDCKNPVHVTAVGQGLVLVPIHKPAVFEVRTGLAQDYGSVQAQITSPSERTVSTRVMNNHNGTYTIEYTPTEVGTYSINVSYDGVPIPDCPISSKAYDSGSIVVSQMPNGVVGSNVQFTIDVTQAGEGQLEIMVNRGEVPNTVKMRGKGVFLVSFIPMDTRPHYVDIKFNGELLPRCPMTVPILDASRVTVQGDGLHQVAVNRQSQFRVTTQSAGEADLRVKVAAPNGEQVPAKIVQQPDGDFKVEYSSKYTGRHTVEILYAGQAIMGSPFYVEIYDPNKIRVEGEKKGVVGQRIEFDIIRNEAGKAELGLSITSPSGRTVPYDLTPTALGEKVTYMPSEVGGHNIYITYGGLEVPGCPISQNMVDTGSGVVVAGEGLYKAVQNRTAEFKVDARGHRGDLYVQVDGPNSIARCQVVPDSMGSYIVRYTPVECGQFTITLKWNGRELSGSPFHPEVVNPAGLQVIGGWSSVLDSNNQLALSINQTKRLEFDTTMTGPGQLTADVQGPAGNVPTYVDNIGGRCVLTFTPTVEGDYYINIYWSGVPIPNSPFHGFARNIRQVNHEKVVLTGRGLLEAKVREEAEFVIDGTEAGTGSPEVSLTGVKADIVVQCTPISSNKYRCNYTPKLPGAYLLNIMWSEKQVRGSPFKVNVTASSDATKVMATGEGLKMGVMGRDIKATIDTRRAGPGELTAHCMGPSKAAVCELFDHHDGTFTLSVKPAEPGQHVLQVQFGGEHVPGSPFVLKIAGAPDASKVRVAGPGIEHGILATYQSKFVCETKGAGAGQLTVRIRGPKGAFRVEMQRQSQKDRTILCRYEPREVGDYIISVKWSGEHVPGSPFRVQIFDTQSELERFLRDNPDRRTNAPALANGWEDDF